MIFKDDWEKCKERFDAFWSGDMLDRCCVSVTAPRTKPLVTGAENKSAGSLEEKWLDCAYRYEQAIYAFSHTFYGGEAFPNFQINLGPGVVAAFMGAPYALKEDTVWFGVEPVLNNWSSLPGLRFREDSEMWQAVVALARYYTERARGDFKVCNTDLGGTLDIAASLRGTEQLLIDLLDNRDEVLELCRIIDDIWLSCYDKVQRIINDHQEGSTDWYPTWCREKRSYAIQCDFSAMISPAAFVDFAMPSLIRQAKSLDRAIYHLDGPGQLPHLEHLLEIDAIDGIQWVPGQGQPGGCDERWFPYYRRIQEKGRKLIIMQVEPAKIGILLDAISPRGVLLADVRCRSEAEAMDLLKLVEKLV